MLTKWDLVEASIDSLYPQIRLERDFGQMTWREFRVKLDGAMASDTPLARYFAPKSE